MIYEDNVFRAAAGVVSGINLFITVGFPESVCIIL